METAVKSCFRFLWCSVVIACVIGQSQAVTYYVDAAKPGGGDGLSWATAFNNIQNALTAANPMWMQCTAPSDRIWVKQGIYTLSAELAVGAADTLYGGFPASKANPVWEDRNWRSYATIIDGNNTVRCVKINHYAVIDGFYIQNGSAANGAGVYVDATPIDCGFTGYMTPYVQNCWIRNNTASGSGGGLYDDGSDAHVRYCEFSGNAAPTGGAIYQLSSGTEIIRCNFHGNESTAPGSLGGGAIAGFGHNTVTGKYVAITNCLFYDNVSGSWGGAIAGNQTYPTITNCTFSGNEANIVGGAFFGNTNSEAPRFRNCICWGDVPDEISVITASTYLDVSYCDIEGGWTGPGSNNIDQDPLFMSTSNYRLQMGSPCIDTGSNGYAPSDDLDGLPRPQDGDNNGTATADRGAYEKVYTNVDLIVQSIVTDPEYPIAGQPCDVTVTVYNAGTTPASPFYLDWYAHRASPPGIGNYGTLYQQFTSLAAGATETMTKSYTYSATGVFSMYAQTDTDQQVEEYNESNNVLGPQSVRVIGGELLAFDTALDTHNANRWFGGDDRTAYKPRNLGAGQSIVLARQARVQSAGFQFASRFDYDDNPDGFGHAVRLYLHVRNASGTILRTVYEDVPAVFEGGWIDFDLGTADLWLNAEEEYIFTCYVYKGEVNELSSSIYARNDNPWPLCSGYTCTQNVNPADMTTWANWTENTTWDFNFRITGQYVEPYPADLNVDWSVTIDDAVILAAEWLSNDCLMLDWCDGCDINWSTKVELRDFAVMSSHWDKTYPVPAYSAIDADVIANIDAYGHLSGVNIYGSNGSEFNPGTYFVYKTSQGRLGKFLVTALDPASNNQLTISYVTYSADGSIYKSGTGLIIRGTYSCDLDEGLETGTDRDFAWVQSTSTTRYIDPTNGAQFKLIYRAP